MEINIIDNIIVNHTKHDVESYTGASLQSLLTHKTTKLSFKLTLFFGYNASKNSVSETIEITQTQYERLSEAVIEKNLDVLSISDTLLSDDSLFGNSSTSSLRPRNDSTNTNTNTITTITTNTNTKKDQIENFIPNESSLKAVRDKYPGITQSQGAELIQSFKDQMFNRTAKWQDLQSCFRNYLRKDYIQIGVASAKKGTFAGMSDSRKALIAMKLQDKVTQ